MLSERILIFRFEGRTCYRLRIDRNRKLDMIEGRSNRKEIQQMEQTGKRKRWRRVWAVVFSIALVFGLLPENSFVVHAQEEGIEPYEAPAEGVSYVDEGGVVRTTTGDVTTVAGGTTGWNSGWYYVNQNTTISSRIEVSGDVHLILGDGCTLTASSGIHVSARNSLTIYGQSGGTGTLTAKVDSSAQSAIGGNACEAAGTIVINGGKVTATASNGAATGIGGGGSSGGDGGAGGTITINGGTVNATGADWNTGIGGGSWASAGNITINGGIITAQGKTGESGGIGCSSSGDGGSITINGGTITATGAHSGIGGAGFQDYSKTKSTFIVNGGSINGTLSNITPKNNEGKVVCLGKLDVSAITSEINSVSVDGKPYYIEAKHSGNDYLYLYMVKEENHTVTIRNDAGTITNWTATYKSGGDKTAGYFEFTQDEAGGTSTYVATLAFNQAAYSVNLSQNNNSLYVTVTVQNSTQTNSLPMSLRRIAMDSMDLYVMQGEKIMKAYTNGSGSPYTFPVDVSQLAVGAYTLKAVYGGSSDGAQSSVCTAALTICKTLDSPQSLAWSSENYGRATWNAVTNATGYSVQLYKNGVAEGAAFSTTAPSYDLSITEVGNYTFKVKATGDGTHYVDSGEVTSGSLERKQAKITVASEKNTYTKNAGDPAFDLEGISHDNTDADVKLEYTVKNSTNAAGVRVDNDAVVTVDENGKVTIRGAGTATITVSLPASTHFAAAESVDITIKVEKSAFVDDEGSTEGSSGGSSPAGNQVTVTSSDNTADTPAAEPQIKGAGTSKGWSAIVNKIVETIGNQIKDTEMIKEAINIDMQGTSVVPKTVFDTVKGKDITLVFDMGEGISWTVNGKDVTNAAKGISLGVKRDTDVIPAEVINKVTKKQTPIQMSLEHDGEFGFTATLTMKLEPKNKGLYANLYYYNPKAPQGKELEFICADKIDESGNADLVFSHASDYTVVIDYAPMDGSAPTAKTQAENFLAMSKGAKLTWTSDALKVKWGNVNGAEGYDIYATTCGRKFTSQAKVASVTADQTSATIQEVLGGQVSPARGYKVMVKAYRMADGKKQYLGKSMELYTVGNGHKTYTNAGAMTPSVKTLTLTVGKTKKVRATIIKEDPKKKLLPGKYTASKRYFTADETIATVDEKGNVTAHRKGKTTLYIKAANGVTAKVPIIIK